MSERPDDATPEGAPAEPLPRWLGRVAWGAGAVALYAALLGGVTLDAWDAEHPGRDVVRQDASETRHFVIEVGDEAEDNLEIRDALSLAPEVLVLLAEKKNLKVVITNLEAIKPRVQTDLPASHVVGFFTRDSWRMFVAHDGARPGSVALHELGHFVDAALEDCSGKPAFTEIYQAVRGRGELGQHYLSSEVETFAYVFEQHFFSDRRRKRLAKDYPKASTFITEVAETGACPSP